MPLQYLSFQRSPPRSVSVGSTISVAPLITNDLRDQVYAPYEHDENPVVMKLAWLLEGSKGRSFLQLCKQLDDITWTGPESAWKNVTISVPAVRESGSRLRLAMWVESHEERPRVKRTKTSRSDNALLSALTIDVEQVQKQIIGDKTVFLPVLTPPIHNRSNDSSSSSPKLSALTRLWKTNDHGDGHIEIHEESGFELDKHVWDASIPMMVLLQGAAEDGFSELIPSSPSGVTEDGRDQPLVILELGAGTGLLSIHLSKLLSMRSSKVCTTATNLFASDLPSALGLIERNMELNGLPQSAKSGPSVIELDWFEKALPPPLQEALQPQREGTRPPDLLVLASDCSYNPDTYSAFAALLSRLLEHVSDQGSRAAAILSKKHRHEDERRLWVALEGAGLDAELLQGQGFGCGGPSQDGEQHDSTGAALGQCGIYRISAKK